MKKTMALLLMTVSLLPTMAHAGQVSGYTRSDGTYVQPYSRSESNNTVQDNYSYRGNSNPYTGSTGTNSYSHDTTSQYYSGPDSHGRSGHSGY